MGPVNALAGALRRASDVIAKTIEEYSLRIVFRFKRGGRVPRIAGGRMILMGAAAGE